MDGLTTLTFELRLLGCDVSNIEYRWHEELRFLDLSDLDLEYIPFISIAAIKPLLLSLKSNKLKILPQEVKDFTHLEFLDLGENQLSTLPPEIGQLELKILYIDNNQIIQLPEAVGDIPLDEIYLDWDKIDELPEKLAKKIKYLNLKDMNMGHIRPDIDKMTNLRKLDLAGNNLSQICAIQSLIHLDTLSLGYLGNDFANRIRHLSCLSSLVHLQILKVSSIGLREINCVLPSLRVLHAGMNEISHLDITDLPLLKECYAHNNQIKRFVGHENVEIVDLSFNNLSMFPDPSLLTGVKKLILRKNRIRHIPKKIIFMQALEELDLEHNKVIKIPEELKLLPNLKKIVLRGNPIYSNRIA
ncbi:MAG: hypothetical protein INQ03_09280 [Candidatus Heimdallarchaeota archaeon]|nr:hypothetical protein [Candidatus Heimdallarchaeota archaeon]